MPLQRFSDFDLDLLAAPYAGRLLNGDTLSVRRRLTDPDWGFVEIEEVTPELANADGVLTPIYTSDPRGRTCVMRWFDAFSQKIIVEFVGVVAQARLDPGRLILRLVSLDLAVLNELIPRGGLVDTVTYPRAVDLGTIVAWVFGNVARVPLRYVNDDLVANQFDYLAARGAVGLPAIYRDAPNGLYEAIATSAYTVSTTLYPGYTAVRFAQRQTTFQGGLHRLYADVIGLQAERNFARAIRTVLSDGTSGLGVTVDLASFSAGEAALPPGHYCDGALLEPRFAKDVLRELQWVRAMRLGRSSTTGAWTLAVDQPVSLLQMHLRDGPGDGERNIQAVRRGLEGTELGSLVSELALKYRRDLLDQAWLFEATRTLHPAGHRDPIQSPWIRDRETADRVVDYWAKRRLAGDEVLELEVTQEGRSLTEGALVLVTLPSLGLTDRLMQVSSVEKRLHPITVVVRGWSPASFVYTEAPLPPEDGRGTFTDYSRIAPAAASGLSIASSGTELATDGTTVAFVVLQFTTPTINYAESRVGYKKTSDAVWHEGYGVTGKSGAGVQVKVSGLTPGIAYDYTVQTVNAFKLPSAGDPVLSNQLAPGDTTAPSAPSSIAVRQSGAKVVEIDLIFTPPADWGATELSRSETNDPGTATVIETGKKKRFHDENVSYGTTYYYWGKVVDLTGNKGGFSPSSGHSITVTKTGTGDLEDEAVSQTVMGSGGGNTQAMSYETILSVAITSTGGLLKILATGAVNIVAGPGSTRAIGWIRLVRGGATIQEQKIMGAVDSSLTVDVAGALQGSETPGSGSHTYEVQIRIDSAGTGTITASGILSITEHKK